MSLTKSIHPHSSIKQLVRTALMTILFTSSFWMIHSSPNSLISRRILSTSLQQQHDTHLLHVPCFGIHRSSNSKTNPNFMSLVHQLRGGSSDSDSGDTDDDDDNDNDALSSDDDDEDDESTDDEKEEEEEDDDDESSDSESEINQVNDDDDTEDEYDVDEYDVEEDEASHAISSSSSKFQTQAYDDPISLSPMYDMGITLGIMMLCNKLDLTNAKIIRMARFAFIAYIILVQIFLIYVRYKAQIDNNTTPITIHNAISNLLSPTSSSSSSTTQDMVKNIASSFLSTQSTIKEYDLTQAKSMNNGLLLPMLMLWFLHFKLGQVQPLFFQTASGVKELILSPLFQIYVLGLNLERPFKNKRLEAMQNQVQQQGDEEEEEEESGVQNGEKGDVESNVGDVTGEEVEEEEEEDGEEEEEDDSDVDDEEESDDSDEEGDNASDEEEEDSSSDDAGDE